MHAVCPMFCSGLSAVASSQAQCRALHRAMQAGAHPAAAQDQPGAAMRRPCLRAGQRVFAGDGGSASTNVGSSNDLCHTRGLKLQLQPSRTHNLKKVRTDAKRTDLARYINGQMMSDQRDYNCLQSYAISTCQTQRCRHCRSYRAMLLALHGLAWCSLHSTAIGCSLTVTGSSSKRQLGQQQGVQSANKALQQSRCGHAHKHNPQGAATGASRHARTYVACEQSGFAQDEVTDES